LAGQLADAVRTLVDPARLRTEGSIAAVRDEVLLVNHTEMVHARVQEFLADLRWVLSRSPETGARSEDEVPLAGCWHVFPGTVR
jgi:hypothetical protein